MRHYLRLPAEKIGDFDGQTDIGTVNLKGDAQFDAETKQYTVTGSGENMWAGEDAFHFLWRKTSGNQRLSTAIAWAGTGGHEHRKAGLMIRQSLDADSPYIDAVVHGNGLVSLQYREQSGGTTQEIQAPVKDPAAITLRKKGDLFTLSAAGKNGDFHSGLQQKIAASGPDICRACGLLARSDEKRNRPVLQRSSGKPRRYPR